MNILYLHGLEGSPHGRKATALRDAGHDVAAPLLPKDDFEGSVRAAGEALAGCRPDVVVGSHPRRCRRHAGCVGVCRPPWSCWPRPGGGSASNR